MPFPACHAEPCSPRDDAKTLVLRELGAKRVADWCGVGEATVYQWLSRASDAEPFPADRIGKVVEGAEREGLAFDVARLWPAMEKAVAMRDRAEAGPVLAGARAS